MNGVGLWLLKTAASIVLAAPAIWGGAWFISDYVADKHTRGLAVAVETLTTSLSDLDHTVTAINTNLSQQLIDLERQRADLAIEIAREVQKIQGQQGMQGQDINFLRESIDRIDKSLIEINANTKVRYTVDGGKTYESLDAEAALLKFGVPVDGGSYVIAPWSYNRYDPNTGQIEQP